MRDEPFDRELRVEPPSFRQGCLRFGVVTEQGRCRCQTYIRIVGSKTLVDRSPKLLGCRIKTPAAKQTILKSFRRRLLAGGGYVHSSHQASAALLMIEATTSGFDT